MEKTEEFIPFVTDVFKRKGYDFGVQRIPQLLPATTVYHIRNLQAGNCVLTGEGLSITVQLEPRVYPHDQHNQNRIFVKYGTQKKDWYPNGRIHDSIFTPQQYFQQFPDEAFIVFSECLVYDCNSEPLLGYTSRELQKIEKIGMPDMSYNGDTRMAEQLKKNIAVNEGDNLELAVELIASFYVGLYSRH